MATVVQSQLVAPIAMTSSDALYYTVPATTTAKIGRAVFSNTDSNPHTITVNITLTTSTAANQIVNARALAAGETYVSPELAGAVMPPGTKLRATGDATVTLMVSGLTIVGT